MAVLTKGGEALKASKSTEKIADRRRRNLNRREEIASYLFITPWIIGFLVFTLAMHRRGRVPPEFSVS